MATFDDVFDEHARSAFEAGHDDERYMAKVFGDLSKAELDMVYLELLYTAIKQSYINKPENVVFKHQELSDLGARMKKWPAVRTYTLGFQDPRWDASPQLPTTDALHADSMLPQLSEHLGSMFLGHNNLTHPIDPKRTKECAQELEDNSTGVELSHAMALIIIAMGSRYALEVTDPTGYEVLKNHFAVSKKETLQIDPRNGSVAMALFEDAQLHGKPLPTRADISHFFEGVEHIVQFEDTKTVIETLGMLGQMSPALQKFSLGLYKQYRGMLFSDKPIKTTLALQKITESLVGFIENPANEAMREHAIHAYMALTNRALLTGNLVRLEILAVERVETDWYKNLTDDL